MKIRTLFCALFISFVFGAQAQKFEEGVHYEEVSGFSNSKKHLTEFFSFYCPACYGQEPMMQSIKSVLPEGVRFNRNHIDGMPGRDRNIEQMLTKASIAAKMLKQEDKLIRVIFDHIHVSRKDFTSLNDIKTLFMQNGVSSEDFDKAMSGFGVNTQTKRMQKNTDVMRAQGHTGVPTLLVNGRYKTLPRSLKSEQEYQQLVLFLLNKA